MSVPAKSTVIFPSTSRWRYSPVMTGGALLLMIGVIVRSLSGAMAQK